MDKKKMKRIGNVISNVVMYMFLAICIFAVVMTLFSDKQDDGATEIFGYQMRLVLTESMEKCDQTDVSGFEIGSIPKRSMVFVKTMPQEDAEANEWYASLEVGDVLTFRYVYDRQVTITHRIVSIQEKEGGYTIVLAGDNIAAEDGQLYQTIDTSIAENTNYVIGKVTGQSYLLGFIISLLQEKLAVVFLVIVPCAIIIVLEVLRIMGVLNADRKKKQQEEQQKKDEELEDLRRRLAELEKAGAVASQATSAEEMEEDQ